MANPKAKHIRPVVQSFDFNLSSADTTAQKALDTLDNLSIPDQLSDLSDDTTHRTVTDAEKNTWNSKVGTETDPVFASWLFNVPGLTRPDGDARYLKLDQTTPQSVTGGTPSFADIKIPSQSLGTPTYSTVNDFFNSAMSCGRKTGGVMTDAGSSNIAVTAGTGFIKATDDDNAQVLFFDWPAPSNIAIPASSVRYIGVEYNAGTPRVVARTSWNWNLDTEFPLGRIVNEPINGTDTLHIINNPWWITDGLTNIIERFRGFGRIRRDENVGGLMLSVTGTRNISVTGGTLWSNLNEFPILTIDTAVTGTVELYWYKAGSGWQDADATQYSITQWNDVTQTTLQTIDNNKYCNVWVYAEADDQKIALLYPQAQYLTSAAAEAVGAPSNVPVHIANNGILIGRIIIKQGVTAPVAVQSTFGTTFTASVVTDHGNLTGLGDNDHPQYLLLDQTAPQTVENGPLQTSYSVAAVTDSFYSSLHSEVTNSGSNSNTTGHLVGVLGHATDTTGGRHFLVGTEGKVTGLGGITSAVPYYGLAGFARWYGSGTPNASTFISGAYIKMEEAASEGGAAKHNINQYGFYVDNGVGGNIVFGFYIAPLTQGTLNIGGAIGAASTYTLWMGANTDSTTAAGGITFGVSGDTNLYRSATNTLKTDDLFSCAGAYSSGDITIKAGQKLIFDGA